ncbi:unnamed protein product [Arabis nemorensis]|uniref:Uncharacterized protein n=1 Tax=Arabis nemorensis TaxID=586526 RepID=A0A565C3F1_9BRAS|nr:unnamed protein product [Arabis nemorensis]
MDFSWRLIVQVLLLPSDVEIYPNLLALVLRQRNIVCWAVALTRQLEAFLKKYGLLDYSYSLPIQVAINLLPWNRRGEHGYLIDIYHAIPIFAHVGTVLEEERPLTFSVVDVSHPTDLPHAQRFLCRGMKVHFLSTFKKTRGREVMFEQLLRRLVKRSPITVWIPMTASNSSLQGKEIYNPSSEELEGS